MLNCMVNLKLQAKKIEVNVDSYSKQLELENSLNGSILKPKYVRTPFKFGYANIDETSVSTSTWLTPIAPNAQYNLNLTQLSG